MSGSGLYMPWPAIAAMFGRMLAKGLTEEVEILTRAPMTDPVTGKPVGREYSVLGTINAWVTTGGGTLTTNQEGQRASAIFQVYYVNDAASLAILDASTQVERWIRRGNGDQRVYRITTYDGVAPYVRLMIEAGGTADKAGNTR